MDKPIQWFIIILTGFIFLALGLSFDRISFQNVSILIFAVVGTLLLMVPMDWALIVLFLYLGFEGFFKIVSSYHPVVHVGADILMGLFTFKVIVKSILERQGIPRILPPLIFLFLLHFFWFLITFLNPHALSLTASVAAVKIYVTMVLLYFFGFYITDHPDKIKRFMIPWLLVAIVHIIFSLYQSAHGPSSVLSIHPGYAKPLEKLTGYAFRPFGLTHLPGAPSIFIYMVVPFAFYFLFHARSIWTKIFCGLFVPFSTLVLVLCQVRSALLKSIVSTFLVFIFTILFLKQFNTSVKRSMLGFILILSVGLGIAVPKLMDVMVGSYEDNLRAVERSLTLFDYQNASNARRGGMDRFMRYVQEAPLGAGLSRTGAAAGKFADEIAKDPYFGNIFFADNFWIAVVVDLGIPGVILLTLIVFMILFLGLKNLFQLHSPELKALQLTLVCSLISIVMGFYGAEAILYNPEASFFWFFSGVLMKIPYLDRDSKTSL